MSNIPDILPASFDFRYPKKAVVSGVVNGSTTRSIPNAVIPAPVIMKKLPDMNIRVNSTPFVRQYGILLTNGVLLYAERSAEQEVYWGIQTGSR